ncbi:MAG: helix-turn-helix transcriptional regulator [Bdellovibrionales bacterium]
MNERIIVQSELTKICPFSRSTIWRWERSGLFPKRRQVSPGRVGWLASEVEEFLAKMPKARRAGK